MEKALAPKFVAAPPLPRRPPRLTAKTGWTLLLGAALLWALVQAGLFRPNVVNPGGWPLVIRFAAAALRPNFNPDFLRLTANATLTTLAFAVAGVSLSMVIGAVGGVLASQVWWETVLPRRGQSLIRLPWLALRGLLAAVRAIHEIIWGLFFVNIIGLNPLTAILAIAIPFGAATAKVFSEILDETPRAPFEALKNSGAPPLAAFSYTLLPQAFRDWLSYGFYRFECAIRAAAVLGIIGAGGLGYQIFLSLQTLRYEEMWTLFLALFLLNGLADFWSGLLRRRLGAPACADAACPDRTSPRRAARSLGNNGPDAAVRASLVVAAVLVPFSFWYAAPGWDRLFSARTAGHLAYVAAAAFPPNFAALPPAEWLRLTGITLAMSLLATAGAALAGLALSFPAANNFFLPGGLLSLSRSGAARRWAGVLLLLLTRAVLLVARSIPPPIWALVVLFVLFPGILPGAVALGLYTLGVLGRLMAEVVENLDPRPLAALKSLGAPGGLVFAYGVLPQAWPRFVGYFLYRLEETLRATVVVGLVGAGGLGRLLTEQLSSFDYRGVLATLIIFVSLILMVDLLSAAVRRAFHN